MRNWIYFFLISIVLLGFPSLIYVEKEEPKPTISLYFVQEILSPAKQVEENSLDNKQVTASSKRYASQIPIDCDVTQQNLPNWDSNGNPLRGSVYRVAVYFAFPPEDAFG